VSWFRSHLNLRLARHGYRLIRTHKPDLFEIILIRYLENHGRRLNFIQIGANDGKRFDPIYEFATSSRFHFRGLVVEPVPRFFQDLQHAYRDKPDIRPVNAAIHNSLSEATLYVVNEKYDAEVPEWALGTASFNKSHVIKAEVPEEYVEAIQVPCVSLENLMEREDVNSIDLLQIDTEGYDSEIVRSIDFSKTRPSMIHFEHGMADGVMVQPEMDELIKRLNEQGYQVLLENYDAVAFLPYEMG
jgi:FkbM family methyltransferase